MSDRAMEGTAAQEKFCFEQHGAGLSAGRRGRALSGGIVQIKHQHERKRMRE